MRGDPSTKGSMVVKPDMLKAFDWVEWSFLANIMHRMGFCQQWVVMKCIKSASFLFLINDILRGHVIPS